MTDAAQPLRIERLERPMPAERDALLALEASSFSNPWTAETLDTMLASPVTRIYVARDGAGEIVAFCACWAIEDELHINSLAVTESRRRQGIASRLLEAILLEIAPARATLEVRRSNAAALRLYERFGFKVTAVRPQYYEKPEEDGLILWRNP